MDFEHITIHPKDIYYTINKLLYGRLFRKFKFYRFCDKIDKSVEKIAEALDLDSIPKIYVWSASSGTTGSYISGDRHNTETYEYIYTDKFGPRITLNYSKIRRYKEYMIYLAPPGLEWKDWFDVDLFVLTHEMAHHKQNEEGRLLSLLRESLQLTGSFSSARAASDKHDDLIDCFHKHSKLPVEIDANIKTWKALELMVL